MNKYTYQLGFSMIDILIGLVIGFIVVFTTYGSLLFFQTYLYRGLSGNSILANGRIGLSGIESNLKVAGLGFYMKGTAQCSSLYASYNGNTIANNILAMPIYIQEGNSAPDRITILNATSIYAGVPAQVLTATTVSSGSTVNVNNASHFQSGNLALIGNSSATPCTIVKITNIINNGINTLLTYDSGTSPSTNYPMGSFVTNLGNLSWTTWQINNNNLEMLDNITGNATVIADNIVHLQAQYGISSSASSKNISQWVNATSSWATLTNTIIPQIRAIRVALVARSPNKEKPSVTGAACDTTTQFPVPWLNGTVIDLSRDPDWRCYRYKIFKTVIPLKNVIIGG